ncbi:histidine kinase (plasmid) [Pseudorhodobacter turbinis]|uniref:Histidine kinase n=1 Tax=Pseudorhodobacter turbinis TaxID=2500533 RepID=A0A4P8ELN3_9RHOB|nr:histidine kinase [Pseudorhodobacter turbinis]
MGRIFVGAIVISALLAGAAIYYLQVYGYYQVVEASSPAAEIRMTTLDGVAEPLLIEGFEGIDADSSPIRFRACFRTPQSMAMLTETYRLYDGATPLVAPGWFDCFDAQAIGQALEEGHAIAYLGEENIQYGIDRVIAIMDDGRAYAWNQINHCGEVVFNGAPAPADCPEK